jgi:UDP-GlcNAc:undecaprenyl-phosphate/decaprenyl-phosphate GlcNAc-1-phosphate transferase
MNNYLVLIYAGFFICATILSVLLNGLFLRFARTLGIRNNAEDVVRWSSMQKPSLGGITFFVIFLFANAAYAIFFPHNSDLFDKSLLGLLCSVTAAFLMGLGDDAYNTKPLLKFLVQLGCGWLLIATGNGIEIFGNDLLNTCMTLLWVVGIMNSINMLDNMDAITACVSIFILLNGLIALYVGKDFNNPHIVILIGAIGALLGFLFYNWHPSKLYMGDTGSQFLGILLAFIGIKYFMNAPDFGGNHIPSKQVLVTALAFIIPITDTTTVFINRILRKQSPFVGGKDHTTHHLSYLGLSDSQVAIAFCGISLISMMLILLIQGTIVHWNWNHILLFSGYIAIVSGILFGITRYNKKKGHD